MEEDFVDHLHRRLCDFHKEYFKYYARWTDTQNETITFPLWAVNGRLCGYQRYQWNVVAIYNVKLLGYSEYYVSRVCESTEITYLAEDVYAEVID